jgi:hypothetical protein
MLNNCRQELGTRSDYFRCVCVGRMLKCQRVFRRAKTRFLPTFGNSHSVRRAPRLPRNFGASRQLLPNSPARYPPSKVNRSATGSFKRLASLSKVSNDGAFLPRSIRLRKSTDMSSVSANCSWVIRRCARICRKRRPNFSLRVVTWTLFPNHKNLSQRTFAFAFLPEHATGKGLSGLFLCSYFRVS